MALTKWFRQLQPLQLYLVLGMTIAFFIIELIVSHITHALTLLIDSYHMLCNIMALIGCIITMKHGSLSQNEECNFKKSQSQSKASSVGEELTSKPASCADKKNPTKISSTQETQMRKLKNTFGWARIDVISMLMCCVFLASFSFSILVEALQTLVHIDHQDEMHHPIAVFCIGTLGLLLNGMCYLLIGGYTFHQGSFLYITESGDVVLSKVVVNQSVQHGERRLSRTKYIHTTSRPQKQRQDLWEMLRDINGCIIVIICAALIYFADKSTAKYIDPIMSIISTTVIMVLSFPYMKESCLILLQTIPDTINIDVLKAELLNHFPDIINIHDFHIWQLTASKIFSTVHMIFENPKVYCKIKEDIKAFFIDNGISHITIQPEFFNKNTSTDSIMNKMFSNCLFSCQEEGCKKNHCCPEYSQDQKLITASRQSLSKNCEIKGDEIIIKKSVKIDEIANETRNVDEELKNQINLAKSELAVTKCPGEVNTITANTSTVTDNVVCVARKAPIDKDDNSPDDEEKLTEIEFNEDTPLRVKENDEAVSSKDDINESDKKTHETHTIKEVITECNENQILSQGNLDSETQMHHIDD